MIRSPQTGYVVDKKIVAGASVEAKMTLFEVADLSTVWIEADVYEKDIAFLQAGQTVEATVEAYPNRTFTGKLALVYPQLDAATRTNRVRFELDNPRHELRPGMFATVRINTPLESIEPYKSWLAKADAFRLPSREHEFLVVPERAVIDTGAKKVVYVEREPGMFEGVEVELGPRHGEYYPVVKGLKRGRQGGGRGRLPDRRRNAAQPGRRLDLFRRQRRPAVRSTHSARSHPLGNGPAPSLQSRSTEDTGHVSSEQDDLKNINQLPEADRPLAMAQRTCPITGAALGSMGVPVKIILRGQTVFLCCRGASTRPKESRRDAEKTCSRAANEKDRSMIEKIIEFSIRNRFVVILRRSAWWSGASTPSSTRRSTRFPTCRRTR